MTRWKNLVVPLVGSQADQDPQSGAPRLFDSKNARFTRTSTISPRPGFSARRQTVIWDPDHPATTTSQTYPGAYAGVGHTDAFVPSWLATMSRGSGDELLLGCTNQLLTFDTGAWYQRGVIAPYTFRRIGGDSETSNTTTVYAHGVKGATYDMLIHGTPTSTASILFLGDVGQVIARSDLNGVIAFDSVVHNSEPAVVYVDGAGPNIKLKSFGTLPNLTPVVTNIATDFGAAGVRGFWESTTNTGFYVWGTTTPNEVKVAKVTSALVVTTATFNLAAVVDKVNITASAGKVLVAAATAAGAVTTKVYSHALADQAIDVAYAGVTGGFALGCSDTLGWVACHDVGVQRRSMTAATSSTVGLKAGVRYWSSVYVVNNRALVGCMENGTATDRLLICDVTDVSDYWPTAARVINGARKFGFQETPTYSGFFGANKYVTFDLDSGVDTRADLYQLLYTAPKCVTYRDCLYMSGSCPTVYDGSRPVEQGFNRVPALTAVAGGVGTLAAGSYTYQATYRYLNAAGQVERSIAALPQTVSVSGIQLVTLVIDSLELTNKQNVVIEVWRTEVNPGSNAPLYLLTTVANSLVADTVTTTDVNPTAGLTSNEILYTVGNILDQQDINADAGFTVSGNRLWALSEDRLWVSNQFAAGQTPWFNTLTAQDVSTELGAVRAVETSGDKVFAFYAAGVTVTGGPGFNELGQGSGYFIPQLVGRVPGPLSPRGACEVPGAVAFQSAWSQADTGARLTLVTQSLQTSVLPFPKGRQTNPDSSNWDLTSSQARDELYVFQSNGLLRVFNYRTLQWSLWTVGSTNPTSGTLFGGFLNLLADTYVYVEGSDPTSDLDFTATPATWSEVLWTNWMSAVEGKTTWGKVRELALVGNQQDQHTVTMAVQYDGLDTTVDTYSATVATDATTTWPNGAYKPGVQLSRQKCASLALIATIGMISGGDGSAEVTALEMKVLPVDALAPRSSRNSLPHT